MIALRGRAASANLKASLTRLVWRITTAGSSANPSSECAYLVGDSELPPDGYPLYLIKSPATPNLDGKNTIELPPELYYLQTGDIVSVSIDGLRLAVLWRQKSRQNSVLLTEQCDNYCLMCSQPPKQANDDWLLDRAIDLIELLPPATTDIIFTGGEPTLYGQRFIELLELCKHRLSIADIHILSNGRKFAEPDFALSYAEVDNPRMMVGIPIYGAEPSLHDYVVQADGAFDATIRGILQLVQLNQRVELRVVLHKQTAPAIVEIAEFIARNLPFVEQVALMGLEVMGLARANLLDVWIDAFDYKEALSEAVSTIAATGVKTMIYNHQLCLLERRVWPYAVRSISDWKNEYDPICETCAVRDACGGLFHSANFRSSSHIHPMIN